MTVRRTGEASSTIVASATETASGNSGSLAIFDRIGLTLHLLVDVTAVVGSDAPTMDLAIEWSNDGSTFAVPQPADTFTQITAASVAVKAFTILAPEYRIVWTHGGIIREVQRILHDYGGGTFTVTFDSEGPSAAIPWNDNGTALKAALELFTNITTVDVVEAATGDWNITFEAGSGNVPLIEVDGALLTTGGTSIDTTETTPGSLAEFTFSVDEYTT